MNDFTPLQNQYIWVCSKCQSSVQGQHHLCVADYDTGEYERGVVETVEAIATWLEAHAESWLSNIEGNGKCKHESYSWDGCETCGLTNAAEAVRNGEWKT